MIEMESFFLSLKAAWAARLVNTSYPWAYIAKHYLNKLAPFSIIYNMSFQERGDMVCIESLPKFYQEVIVGITKSKVCNQIGTKSDLLNQQLWGNQLLYPPQKIVGGYTGFTLSVCPSDRLSVGLSVCPSVRP